MPWWKTRRELRHTLDALQQPTAYVERSSTICCTNMAMENGSFLKMYFLLKVEDFPACDVSLLECKLREVLEIYRIFMEAEEERKKTWVFDIP